MVRTADSAVRVGGKAPKSSGRSTSSNDATRSRSPSSTGERGFSSYNSVCARETPTWQKPITTFFQQADSKSTKDQNQSTSKKQSDDVAMMEADKQNEQQADVEHTIHQEKLDVNKNDKENCSPNEPQSVDDAEMKELNENTKKKVNIRDDDDEDEVVPKKKIKLDANMYEQFEMIEQSKVMLS